MRIYFYALVFTLIPCTFQNILAVQEFIVFNAKTDTLKAREWLNKVEPYSDSARYDSAAFCYEQAAKIYKKARIWEKYVFCRNGIFVEIRNKHDNTDLFSMVRENLSLALKYLDPESAVLGNSFMNVGHVYADRSNVDSALWYFNKGLDIWKLHYGEDHIKMANAYANIGIIYEKDSNYKKAEEYLQRATQIRIKVLGPDHPDIAISYNSLGYMAYLQGNIDECGDYFLKAIAVREKYYGENHPITAESYNNYAALCLRREDYQQSLFYNNKALEARLKTLGPKNPNVALSYNNIGNVYLDLGEYDKSEEYHNKALKLRLELWGDVHPDLAQSYQNIGVLNFEKGEYRKALENAEEVLRILEAIYGKDHPQLDDAYNNIGAAYEGLGDLDNAYSNLYKALELRRQVSPDNPALTVSYNNVGAICKFRGDYDLAQSYYLKQLELINRYYDYETNELAGAFSNLGELYYIQKEYGTALEYFKKSRDIHKQLQGSSSPEILGSLINIASVYAELDSLDLQSKIIDEALAIVDSSFGDYHPNACALYTQKAVNLHKRGENSEAIKIQKKVIGIMEEMYTPPHPDLADALNDLGLIFYESQRADSALFYLDKATEANYYGEFPTDISLVDYMHMLDELVFLETLLKKAEAENDLYKSSGRIEELELCVNTYQTATRLASLCRQNYTLPDSKILLLNSML